MIKKSFREFNTLNLLINENQDILRVKHLNTVKYKNLDFPIQSIEVGSKQARLFLVLIGGVHGLERIGTQVILSFFHSILSLLRWDKKTQETFDDICLISIPIANPVGIHLFRRSNGKGVDLMRNSPISSEKISPYFLPGGQNFSPLLPWFRGDTEKPEIETQTLLNFTDSLFSQAKICILVDIHSGFGFKDQLWFPFASSKKIFPHISEVIKLKKLLDSAYPNHFYQIEPQSLRYSTHGDLWDYAYQRATELYPSNLFLPLTLEMGSWIWLKKNPKQIFNSLGLFHPIVPHREKRVLRRHKILFEFLLSALYSHTAWHPVQSKDKQLCLQEAHHKWYQKMKD